MTGQASQAAGVVKVRLAGSADDIESVAALLAEHAAVIERSAPYPNRRDPGVRVYLTVQVQEGGQ
jgi:hypothetical protein